MERRELTEAEHLALRQALSMAIGPLKQALYGETMERWDQENPGKPLQFPAGRPLAELVTLKHAAEELEGMASAVAKEAGAKGASYADLGAAWGITRQAARKRWPMAVDPGAARRTRPPVDITAFGGKARVGFDSADGGWWWVAAAANGVSRDTGLEEDAPTYDTSEEAAAAAGAFLAANTGPKEPNA
ncbi:hypothetical protein GCM10009548_95040 [Streptomyces malaysiensis subsp. malaysiensis]|uniref:hypothetical protein n=1 Tax=Streptomyces TaxID=1883 RepID=UPI001E632BA7|nr:hypothetical protein [Streptomyces sp. HNM0561]UHH23907.1 hypothetical protein LUV23_47550 [Streptomyces sp. HNM0561]